MLEIGILLEVAMVSEYCVIRQKALSILKCKVLQMFGVMM